MGSSTARSLSTHYKGCLVGAVIGDCLGSFYEGERYVSLSEVVRKVKSLKTSPPNSCQFTDDTAMTRMVAKSLIDKRKFDGFHMAKCFAVEFQKEPFRGYGAAAPVVLGALLHPEGFEDINEPANRQFNGSGSYGNGGAMRTSPVALFGYGNPSVLQDVATRTARLTHANRWGYNGAVVQSLAINLALESVTTRPLNRDKYAETLLEQVRALERDTAIDSEDEQNTYMYTRAMESIRDLLNDPGTPVPTEKVVELLGNNIRAHQSVPAAIYAFLRCVDQDLQDDTETDRTSFNPFCHTVLYAISLGGDTDTIASMAGAIAGSYHGLGMIPQDWMSISEGCDQAEAQAEQLFNIVHEPTQELVVSS